MLSGNSMCWNTRHYGAFPDFKEDDTPVGAMTCYKQWFKR